MASFPAFATLTRPFPSLPTNSRIPNYNDEMGLSSFSFGLLLFAIWMFAQYSLLKWGDNTFPGKIASEELLDVRPTLYSCHEALDQIKEYTPAQKEAIKKEMILDRDLLLPATFAAFFSYAIYASTGSAFVAWIPVLGAAVDYVENYSHYTMISLVQGNPSITAQGLAPFCVIGSRFVVAKFALFAIIIVLWIVFAIKNRGSGAKAPKEKKN